MNTSTIDTIWTVGHSTRTISDFIDLLQHYQLETLADVRRFPGSRRLPQFGSEQLEASLNKASIDYHLINELGGRRRPEKNSSNTVWRNTSFRGYADYMESTEFKRGLEQLYDIASQSRTVIMCAELLWWRCHRSMVADVLMVNGICVMHIQDKKHITEHPFTQPARLYHDHLSYEANKGKLLNERARKLER